MTTINKLIFLFFIFLYSQAVSELFLTASASTTTLSLKAILYDEQRAFGMMNREQ